MDNFSFFARFCSDFHGGESAHAKRTATLIDFINM